MFNNNLNKRATTTSQTLSITITLFALIYIHRETQRHTYRQTDRQKDRQTDRQTGYAGQTDSDRLTYRQTKSNTISTLCSVGVDKQLHNTSEIQR